MALISRARLPAAVYHLWFYGFAYCLYHTRNLPLLLLSRAVARGTPVDALKLLQRGTVAAAAKARHMAFDALQHACNLLAKKLRKAADAAFELAFPRRFCSLSTSLCDGLYL